MYSRKKVTKEDTWRPDDLIRHIRSQEEDSRRREPSQRDPERESRRHREESGRRGEVRDEREKESRREREREREREQGESEYRDREKERQRERYKDRDREKEKERDRDGLRDREREREKERVKDRDREREREKERVKDRDREKRDREKDRDRTKERDREKDREREKRDKENDREREKRDKEKDRDRLKEKERDREKRDREKDRERERRRTERENERRKERTVGLYGDDKVQEREKERKERQREREHRREGERHGGEDEGKKRREHERQDKQHSGQTDRDKGRERRRREREQDGEMEQRHRCQDGGGVMERDEREKQGDVRHQEQENKHRNPELEAEREVTEEDVGEEDYGNEDYEDDFEDYEEDFEEFDEEEEEEGEVEESRDDGRRDAEREMSPRSRRELEAVQRAMEKENELIRARHSTPSTEESEISRTASADSRKTQTYGRVIDFTAARQREMNQHTVDKQKKRSAELLRLIELDFSVTEGLLDLPPVREYDLYIKSYGMSNTKQAYVQCNEDNIERDTQTEETDVTDKWTQHPPESSVTCGGTQISQNASVSMSRTTVDSKRLTAFLRSATQVMAVLLEENITANNSVKKMQSQTHTHSFSDGCVQLNTDLNFLQGRQVTLLHFSQTQTHTMLSVHSPHYSGSDITLDTKTLICVWNIWEPSTPQRILIYEAEVRSCCFSPGKATLVFAGTDVGSVLVWDLREHSGSHLHSRVCEEEWTLRHPTFSTDAVLSGAGHFSPVVSVEPVLVNMGAGLRDPLLPDQEESLGLSFQLGSLDENGLLNLWVVVELSKADESGSQTDLGLRPGGKVKLLHSSSLQTSPLLDSAFMGVTSHLSFVLKFLPSDSNHYFIGSNMGLVRHGTRHGLRAVPKIYRPKDGERPVEVTALDFCPTGEPFFLVGCSDGSVRLHSLACEDAVCEWTVGSGRAAVQSVHFSPTRCSVFCALDSTSVLHIWDLTQRDESPIITHDLHTDPVSATAVFGDATRQNPYSGIALAKHSGRLEIHFLIPALTLPKASDAEKLNTLAHDTL